jgi:hypothetical protein
MATERLSMRNTREILRQKWTLGRSHREVGQSVAVSSRRSTGTASDRRTASSGSTARSSGAPTRSAPSPDWASALRLVTAVALNVTAIWTDRRYLDMSLLVPKEVVVAKAA